MGQGQSHGRPSVAFAEVSPDEAQEEPAAIKKRRTEDGSDESSSQQHQHGTMNTYSSEPNGREEEEEEEETAGEQIPRRKRGPPPRNAPGSSDDQQPGVRKKRRTGNAGPPEAARLQTGKEGGRPRRKQSPPETIPIVPTAEEIKAATSDLDRTRLNTWYNRLGELCEYKKAHGDCNVSKRYSSNPELGLWVGTQRSQKKYLDAGKKSNMTARRIEALEAVGFSWWAVKSELSWDTRFKELEAYRRKFGDCNVPKRYAPKPALGNWVHEQRSQKKNLDEGKKSYITLQRIEALEAVGFTWGKDFVSAWDTRFKELEEYRLKFGDCNVLKRYRVNPALGRWVAMQRSQYALKMNGQHSRMTQDRADRLSAIGFCWSHEFVIRKIDDDNC